MERRRSIQQQPNNLRKMSGVGLGVQQITNYRPQSFEMDVSPTSQFPNYAGGGVQPAPTFSGFANATAQRSARYDRDVERYRQTRLRAAQLRAKANGLDTNMSAIQQRNPNYNGATMPMPQRPQPVQQQLRQPTPVRQPAQGFIGASAHPQKQQVSPAYGVGRGAAIGLDEGLQNGNVAPGSGNWNMNVDPGTWNMNTGGGGGGNSGGGDPYGVIPTGSFGGSGTGAGGPAMAVGAGVQQMLHGIQDTEGSSNLRRDSGGNVVGPGIRYGGAVARATVNPEYGVNKNRLDNANRGKDALDNWQGQGLPYGGEEGNVPIEAAREAAALEQGRAQGAVNTTSKAYWDVQGQPQDAATQKYHADLARWREEQVRARGGVPLGAIAPNPAMLNAAANIKDEDAFNQIAPYMDPRGPMEAAHRDNMNGLEAHRYEQLTPAIVQGAQMSIEENKALRAQVAVMQQQINQLMGQKAPNLFGGGAGSPSSTAAKDKAKISQDEWNRRYDEAIKQGFTPDQVKQALEAQFVIG